MSEPVDQAAKPDELLDDAGEQAGLTSDDAGQAAPADAGAASGAAPGSDEQIAQLKALAAERTEDLQRVHAEYVNYKRRVDRDRALARQGGIEALLRDLLPVFDSITAAEKQGELTGGFKLTADELSKVTKVYGLESFGAPGDEFDPRLHEALMQVPDPNVTEMVVREVMQNGFRINDQVVRPARVVVSVPAE